jgi:hypothetical protein
LTKERTLEIPISEILLCFLKKQTDCYKTYSDLAEMEEQYKSKAYIDRNDCKSPKYLLMKIQSYLKIGKHTYRKGKFQ